MSIKNLQLNRYKNSIVSKWANSPDVEELLFAWSLTTDEFIEKYANGVFDHLLSVIEGRQKAGDCPKLMLLMEYLASKIVSVGDIFALCIRFRHCIGDVIFEECSSGDSCFDFYAITKELHSFFDLNLRGALDRYYETLYQKERELKVLVEKTELQEELLSVQSRQAIMGEMIAAIAHQWKQPLNVVSLEAMEISLAYEANEEIDETLRKGIKSILDQVRYMNQTIDDFKSFFKPTKDDQCFCLNDAIETVFSLIGKQYKKYGIEFEFTSDKNPCFRGRISEFVQVLLVLFSNAKDAIVLSGTGRGKIVLTTNRADQQEIITIEDSGGGIKEDALRELFKPYFTNKKDGTGIGLYIAKQITQKMGGDLSAKNGDLGARFCISLPIFDK